MKTETQVSCFLIFFLYTYEAVHCSKEEQELWDPNAWVQIPVPSLSTEKLQEDALILMIVILSASNTWHELKIITCCYYCSSVFYESL